MNLRFDSRFDMAAQRLRSHMDWFARVKILGHIPNPFWWPMGDKDVDIVRDRLPNRVEFGPRLHVGPIEELGRVR